MSDEFRMTKRLVPLDLSLADGTTRAVSVFLAPQVTAHAGGERLADLMNRDRAFFPAMEREGHDVVAIGRRAILYVRAAADVDVESDAVEVLSVEVMVTLLNGRRLRGTVRYTAPPQRSRLTDHLNAPELFFSMLDGAFLMFVNKRHVVSVVETAA